MATPPIMAVGFLCQRSVWGEATKPQRRAPARTSGVATRVITKAAATGKKDTGISTDLEVAKLFQKLDYLASEMQVRKGGSEETGNSHRLWASKFLGTVFDLK